MFWAVTTFLMKTNNRPPAKLNPGIATQRQTVGRTATEPQRGQNVRTIDRPKIAFGKLRLSRNCYLFSRETESLEEPQSNGVPVAPREFGDRPGKLAGLRESKSQSHRRRPKNVRRPFRPIPRIYAIVHGRADLLTEILKTIDVDIEKRPITRVVFVFVGGYVDRGRSQGRYSTCCSTMSHSRECVFRRGNHDTFIAESGGSRRVATSRRLTAPSRPT